MSPVNIDLSPEILINLLNNASACAVALLRVGADQFTVSVGDFNKTAFDKLRQAMNKYWPVSIHHNLNRYIGLDLDERFYYLFAKFLPQSDYLLGLIFTPHTPLVRIRQDMTNGMRHVLQHIRSQIPKDESLEQSLQFTLKSYTAPDTDQRTSSKPTQGKVGLDTRNNQFKGEAVPDQNVAKSQDSSPGWQAVPDPDILNTPSLTQQFEVSPSEGVWVPLDEMLAGGENRSAKTAAPSGESSISPPSSAPQPISAERHSAGIPSDWQPLQEASQPNHDLVGLFHEDFDVREPTAPLPEEDFSPEGVRPATSFSGAARSDEETRPQPVDESEAFNHIKLSDITFYLVPRQDSHYLLGELAQRLREWFPGICETYGWQLDFLSVRPDYIKWQLHDFPDALIYEMLEIVRDRTSERIFRVFPNLREGNPSKDFWSPGYLVDRENQDFSTQVLIAHVAKGRVSGQED